MSSCIDAAMVTFGNVEGIRRRVLALYSLPEICEVLLVDHGTDGSGLAAASAGANVVLDPSNPGFGAGMNRAAALGSSPYLLLMNPDADLLPGSLEAGLEALENHPQAGAVQGLIRTQATMQLERSGGKELGPIDLLGRSVGAARLLRSGMVRSILHRSSTLSHQVVRGVTEPTAVEGLAATATLIRRAAFESIEGFDVSYFLYGEDLDLSRRLRSAGYELLYLPVEWAVHECGASASNWWNRELSWWQGTMQFAHRWWSPPKAAAGVLAALIMWCRLSLHQPRRTAEAFKCLIWNPWNAAKAPGARERLAERLPA